MRLLNGQRVVVWHRGAVSTAVVAGIFSLAVCALMVANHPPSTALGLLGADDLKAMKKTLGQDPADERLKTTIRQRDLDLREGYWRRKGFAGEGNLLLLGGLAVFIVAVKSAKQLGKRLPKPPAAAAEPPWPAARVSRRSVAALGVILANSLVILGALYRGDPAAEYGEAVGVMGRRAQQAGGPASPDEVSRNWPAFRGPGNLGLTPAARPPLPGAGAAVRWSTVVPLPGKSSPVVWGNRVFLTGADENQREVLCFDADTGQLAWRRPVGTQPAAGGAAPQVMEDTGFAAPTMAVDGRRVFAVFATGHLACCDLEGNLLWMRHLGVPDNMYGHASSLTFWRDRLLVQYDQGTSAEDGKSALVALDAASGTTVWRAERPVPNSWSTPILIKTGQQEWVVTCGNPWVIAYDPATGQEQWRVDCLAGDVAPSAAFAGGLVFACNIGASLNAIRPDGQGNVTESHIAWSAPDGIPDIVSPAASGDLLFLVTSEGMLTCYDVKTGQKVWEHSLERPVHSSPIVLGGRVFLADKEGVLHVFEAARAWKEVGALPLGEKVETTPAFVGDRIYVRGEERLHCVAAP